jgi:hypothetical protein
MCLADENLYEITMELLADVLSTYCKFFSEEDFQTLYALFNSPWAQERYQRLVEGDYDFDSIQFGLFTLAFGDATLQDLATRTEPQFQQFLTALGGLLGAEGYPVHEDKIFVPALEFWNAFVENMIDSIWTEDEETVPENTVARMHVTQAIERCWRKIQFPPPEIFNSWDSVDRIGFKDVRRDFSDLLQQFYLITKIPILDMFIILANKAAESRSWEELEASLFCLACFSDTIGDTEPRDDYLDKVFTAQIFSLFSNAPEEIPVRTMQSFLLLVDGYADYFEQNTTYLPSVLNIVFGTLGSSALSYKASRTIQKLCSDCRKLLVPELNSFIRQYQSLNANSSVDKHAKEAIMEGIASLIQAIPFDKLKLEPLDELLNFIETDVEECFRLVSSQASVGNTSSLDYHPSVLLSADSPALQLGVGALKSIIGIGRGLQTPHDTPIYVGEDEERSPFWTSGEGSRIQTRISSMVNRIFDVLGAHGDIVDAACHVWRQGFRELEPGAFVVPAAMTVHFLLKANINTPRLGCVIGTACSFVTSHKSDDESVEVFGSLVQWISHILQQQEGEWLLLSHSRSFADFPTDPSNDPEVAQNGIDFLTRLLTKQLTVLMSHQPPSSLEFLFMFTLKALAGSDPLPKGAAADFWVRSI